MTHILTDVKAPPLKGHSQLYYWLGVARIYASGVQVFRLCFLRNIGVCIRGVFLYFLLCLRSSSFYAFVCIRQYLTSGRFWICPIFSPIARDSYGYKHSDNCSHTSCTNRHGRQVLTCFCESQYRLFESCICYKFSWDKYISIHSFSKAMHFQTCTGY